MAVSQISRRVCLAAAALFTLSACVTARMHTQAELNGVTKQCGLALGELFQDESEKRLLFMIRHGATAEERACVLRWARERHLRLVFVNAQGSAG